MFTSSAVQTPGQLPNKGTRWPLLLGRASVFGTEGWGFESLRAYCLFSLISRYMLSSRNIMCTLKRMYASVTEVARELDVSPQCVRANYLRNGQLQGELVGGRWLIPRAELERFKKMDRPHGLKKAYRNGKRN